MKNSTALDAWANMATRFIVLPTGTRMQIRVPSVLTLLRKNLLPESLRKVAMEFATTGVNLKELSADSLRLDDFFRMQDFMIADAVRGIHTADGCAALPCDEPAHYAPVTLEGAHVAEMAADEEDIAALAQIALRQATANEVTAQSLAALGVIEPEQAERVKADEAGETLPALAPFRRERGSSDRGPDGEGMEPAPERATLDRRSRRGVPARRGARA